MSDSDSEQEQRLTLEDLEGSNAEMLSNDENGPIDILTGQRVAINKEHSITLSSLAPRLELRHASSYRDSLKANIKRRRPLQQQQQQQQQNGQQLNGQTAQSLPQQQASPQLVHQQASQAAVMVNGQD
ncbi:hypothetical protein BGZ58_007857 [Dissophora ornata]|nr:hypothetical protein BGZ58_007857 [Dissophora ornata]